MMLRRATATISGFSKRASTSNLARAGFAGSHDVFDNSVAIAHCVGKPNAVARDARQTISLHGISATPRTTWEWSCPAMSDVFPNKNSRHNVCVDAET
jgi:hypothetical protein